jgi:hypothetical protein
MFDKSKLTKEVLDKQIVYTYEDKDVFKNGTDISAKTLKAVEDYRNEYLEKATDFAKVEAEAEMKKNKKIEKAVFNFPFSTSARGELNINIDRSKTYPGMNGGDPVTKSKITVVVKDPYNKVSKKYIKDLEDELTKTLLS